VTIGQRVAVAGVQWVATGGQCVSTFGQTVAVGCMVGCSGTVPPRPASGTLLSPMFPPMAGDASPPNAAPVWVKSSAVGWKSPMAIERVRANKGESAGSFAAPAIRLQARSPPTRIKTQTTF